MKYIIVLLLLLVPTVSYAHTEFNECCTMDQRIDVASFEPIAESISGKSNAVIDKWMMNELKPEKVIDSIVNEPGVVTKDITGLGSVRIRGSRSFDTKYLYDGFPLRDPSHTQSNFGSFFGDTLGFGESEIQILKGASSVLYGSEAIGGVVSIEPVHLDRMESQTEYGSAETFRQSFDSEPVSIEYGNSQKYETVNMRLSHQFGNFNPFLIYQSTDAALHSSPSITNNSQSYDRRDENDRRETKYYQTGIKADMDDTHIKLSYSNSDRRFEFLPNSDGTGFWSDGSYIGESIFFDANSKILGTIFGYSFTKDFLGIQSEGLKSDYSDQYKNDLYLERRFDFDNLSVLGGLRHSINEYSKDRTTYDLSASYHLNEYIIRSHFGTGFRAPSLYELYGAYLSSSGRTESGNPYLSPERASSFDIGIEKTFNEKVTVGVTFFRNSILNKIDYVSSTYKNVDGGLNTYGVESFYEHFLFGNSSLRLSHTRTVQPGMLDVAPYEFNISYRVHKDKFELFSGIGYKDDHQVAIYNNTTSTTDKVYEDGSFNSYATLTYKINDNVSLYGRVENIFNQNYSDGGYRKEGFEAYAGFKVVV